MGWRGVADETIVDCRIFLGSFFFLQKITLLLYLKTPIGIDLERFSGCQSFALIVEQSFKTVRAGPLFYIIDFSQQSGHGRPQVQGSR